MVPYASPGVGHAATQGTHWVFKDPGEARQFFLIIILGLLALIPWVYAQKPPEKAEDE